MMMFSRIARVAVRPQRVQRRTFIDWMTNYPDRVSEKNKLEKYSRRPVERLTAAAKTRNHSTACSAGLLHGCADAECVPVGAPCYTMIQDQGCVMFQ